VLFLLQNAVCCAKRIAIVEAYVRTELFKQTREIFVEKFPNANIPAKAAFRTWLRSHRQQDLWLMQNGIDYRL
jgi:hypothetical protein